MPSHWRRPDDYVQGKSIPWLHLGCLVACFIFGGFGGLAASWLLGWLGWYS